MDAVREAQGPAGDAALLRESYVCGLQACGQCSCFLLLSVFGNLPLVL